MRQIAAITPSQSPRTEITDEIEKAMKTRVRFIHYGALDNLSLDEIRLLGPSPGEAPLAARLRTGAVVNVGREKVAPFMRDEARKAVSSGIDTILVLCNGQFDLDVKAVVVQPYWIVTPLAKSLIPRGKLGILTPVAEQAPFVMARFERPGLEVVVGHGSPYMPERRFLEAAGLLKESSVDVVLLNCFGFTSHYVSLVRTIMDSPVLLPTRLVARVLDELLS